MAQDKDLYRILGVSKNASEDEIKTAYKKLVRKYHPDLNPGDQSAEDKFKEVAVAFEVLGDKKKRKLYDEFGMAGLRAGFDENQARAYQQWGGGGLGDMFGQGGGQGGFDMGSIFEQFFGGGGGGRSQAPRPKGPAKGRDIEKSITIDFLDAILGTKKEIELSRSVHCGSCKGTGSRSGRPSRCASCRGAGRIQQPNGMFASTHICPQCGGTGEDITDPCTSCRGSGLETKRTTLTVTVPAGVKEGSKIRLSRQGHAGKRKGPHGDLFLVPRIRSHAFFTRDDKNVHLELPLTAFEAYNGTQVDTPTPTGVVALRIPAGAQSGQKMRLRGKGVAARKNGTAGDLIVTLKVLLPPKDNPKAKALLEELQETYTEDLRDTFSEHIQKIDGK